ncbi:MAG: hypothetical protein HYW00_00740 [Candidatus Colwellbacteria bacterium]|nr:hypothetical protein [Candidatus Colwellbacteria bacterium]
MSPINPTAGVAVKNFGGIMPQEALVLPVLPKRIQQMEVFVGSPTDENFKAGVNLRLKALKTGVEHSEHMTPGGGLVIVAFYWVDLDE